MAMVWIRVLPQAIGRPVQLDGGVKHRSVEGDTLLLTPGHSREITDEEWAFVQANHADLLPGIERLNDDSFSAAEVVDQLG
jgi:hypothetical protein